MLFHNSFIIKFKFQFILCLGMDLDLYLSDLREMVLASLSTTHHLHFSESRSVYQINLVLTPLFFESLLSTRLDVNSLSNALGRLLLRSALGVTRQIDAVADWTKTFEISLDTALLLIDHMVRVSVGYDEDSVITIILGIAQVSQLLDPDEYASPCISSSMSSKTC